MTLRIQPSILSADFGNLSAEFASIASADGIHVDVMDGHFVPNLTFGLPVVKRMQEIATLPLDIHLMIENLDRWAVEYANLGVFSVTLHIEACNDVLATIKAVRNAGARVGLAIKPGTSVTVLSDYIDHLDQVLVMSVEPGFGGQAFIPESLDKIRQAKALIVASGRDIWLEVDGGIGLSTIGEVANAGADTFVAGSAVFNRNNPLTNIAELRSAALAGSQSI